MANKLRLHNFIKYISTFSFNFPNIQQSIIICIYKYKSIQIWQYDDDDDDDDDDDGHLFVALSIERSLF